MSYILDAIKKTEAGQKDGEVPSLNSEHQHTAFIDDNDSKRWLLPIFAVIVVLFAVVIWLLLKPAPNDIKADMLINHQQDSSPQEVLATTETAEAVVKNNSADDKSVELINGSETTGLVVKKAPLEVQQPVVQQSAKPVIEAVSRRPVTEVLEQAETQQQIQVSQASKSSNKPVFLAAIDHEHWPTLIYTTHIFATEPEDRFVMLNGKAYSIGDTISKGMVVEDIMENDLLVNYQGQQVIVPGLTDVNP
ncbi:general secretion pathway protein GspB [Kangiella koreensis]|uniref:Type II secretion system protein GspB C-terminal domain-containing protein n=1 Tax=Kangiella koreensis (strain DSM 16069 / JCM 12317 / KCTC 12182 / SW-125) TaxID=523791 RepID=C7R7N4_KANKD|nr:general secretion pathway protein GspB [Kangiella koreensis]ACV27567.1 hypothetical protein Kkor_2157 [Kangiella koreensis DSM 16069]